MWNGVGVKVSKADQRYKNSIKNKTRLWDILSIIWCGVSMGHKACQFTNSGSAMENYDHKNNDRPETVLQNPIRGGVYIYL